MEIKRIALLSEHASPVTKLGGVDAGGQNVYISEVSQRLAQKGYLVDIFTRREDPEQPEIYEWVPGVRIIYVTAGPSCIIPKEEMWPHMPRFHDEIHQFKLCHQLHYDVIHGNYWMSGWVAVELGDRWHIPTVQIFHATGITRKHLFGNTDPLLASRIPIEEEVVRRSDYLMVQCPHEWKELVEDYGADERKVVLIPSAVNTHLFYPVSHAQAREALKSDGCVLQAQEFVILYAGRIIPRKGVHTLVESLPLLLERMQGVAPVKLVFVGGESTDADPQYTPEIGKLDRLACKLGVREQVTFVGKRAQNELRSYYCAADVVVTVPWYEPFGLTALEGMACGRPVIGSRVGGIAYTVLHEQSGFLVPPQNPRALAERLYQLFCDPQMRTQMGLVGRKRVVQTFTWSQTTHRIAELYRKVLTSDTEELRGSVSIEL